MKKVININYFFITFVYTCSMNIYLVKTFANYHSGAVFNFCQINF